MKLFKDKSEIYKNEVIKNYFANAFRLGWPALASVITLHSMRFNNNTPSTFILYFIEFCILFTTLSLDYISIKSEKEVNYLTIGWLKINLILRFVLYLSLAIFLFLNLKDYGFFGWEGAVSIALIAGGVESIAATGFAIPRYCFFLLFTYGIFPIIYFFQADHNIAKGPSVLFVVYLFSQIPKILNRHKEFAEKIKYQENLLHEKEQLETLIDLIPAGISWIDKNLNYIRANKYVANYSGNKKEDFYGKQYGFSSGTINSNIALKNFINSDQKKLEQVMVYTNSERESRRLQTHWQKIKDDTEVIILTVDIEEQLKLQEENIQLLKKIDLITFASNFGFFFEDVENNKLVVTKNLLSITNLPNLENAKEADLIFNEKIDPAYRENVINKMEQFYAGKEEIVSEILKFKKSENEYIWLHLFLIAEDRDPLTNRPKKVIGYHQDITKQKELEFKLTQSAKLESIGLMASGIAHEINNPLTIISNLNHRINKNNNLNIEVIDKVKEDIKKDSEKIDLTIKRISKIIQGLKVFSRDSSSDPFEVIKLQELIDDVSFFSESRLKQSSTKFIIETQLTDIELKCQPIALSQVMINLINNSIDAIEHLEDKWIKISIKNIEVDNKRSLVINHLDAGNGIPKEIRDKMMTPFFTTKEIGKGTGLGLSICLGIINNHNGKFYINENSENTNFVIELPI